MTKQKRKSKERPFEAYIIEILEWEAPYSFSLSLDNDIDPGPYWEHIEIKIQGKFIKPQKLAGKELELCFLGNRQISSVMNDYKENYNWEPKAVGGLSVRGERREYIGSLPFDAFPLLSNCFSAGKFKYVILHGQSLRYGSADIRYAHFQLQYDEEEW